MSKTSRRRGGRVLVGYARTSTVDQNAGYEAQRRDLQAAGCTKIFSEQVSSVAEREQLNAALDYFREGDVLIAQAGSACPLDAAPPEGQPQHPGYEPRHRDGYWPHDA